jgi:hypothetical protein
MKPYLFCYTYATGNGHATVGLTGLTVEAVHDVTELLEKETTHKIAITNIIKLDDV